MAAGVMAEMRPLPYNKTMHSWGFLGATPTGYTHSTYPPPVTDLTPESGVIPGTGGGTPPTPKTEGQLWPRGNW